MAEVVLVWSAVWVPGLAHDEDIGRFPDWIWEHGDGSKVDIRIVSWCLASGRTIEVPFWKIFWAGWLLEESLGLGTNITGAVNPDVLS